MQYSNFDTDTERVTGQRLYAEAGVSYPMNWEYGFLTSISHLGISCTTRDEIDQIAALAEEDGCLLLGPMYRNEVVGYICIITDPDGNNVEFSVEQVLG